MRALECPGSWLHLYAQVRATTEGRQEFSLLAEFVLREEGSSQGKGPGWGRGAARQLEAGVEGEGKSQGASSRGPGPCKTRTGLGCVWEPRENSVLLVSSLAGALWWRWGE